MKMTTSEAVALIRVGIVLVPIVSGAVSGVAKGFKRGVEKAKEQREIKRFQKNLDDEYEALCKEFNEA